MEKQEYLNKVQDLFNTLADAIDEYNAGRISIAQMQETARKCWEEKPKDYMLISEDLAEALELGQDLVGEVVSVAEYVDDWTREYGKKLVEEILEDIPSWKDDPHGKFSVRGSNSLIPNILGEPEWSWFSFGYRYWSLTR